MTECTPRKAPRPPAQQQLKKELVPSRNESKRRTPRPPAPTPPPLVRASSSSPPLPAPPGRPFSTPYPPSRKRLIRLQEQRRRQHRRCGGNAPLPLPRPPLPRPLFRRQRLPLPPCPPFRERPCRLPGLVPPGTTRGEARMPEGLSTGLTLVPAVGFPLVVVAGVVMRDFSCLRRRGVGAGVAIVFLGGGEWRGGGSEASGEKVGVSVRWSWRGGERGGRRNAAGGRGRTTLARPVLLLTAGGVVAAAVGVGGTAVGRGAGAAAGRGAAAERGAPRGRRGPLPRKRNARGVWTKNVLYR